ncbi:T3SS effector HopA1 family protein [Streptomyces niveiscabiei]|uniref:T3SS effector HopA1 family protein n=1 Tax=Streptomyces niveiscabiei TaxID=164115 RepID=UPI0029A52493|nr:T3SS effector HopA1 family protein [Streptomyces niveiscabiei]MDX3384417.1 T3SS effector HopA1 family protein [Streptomyces niveiscabiei]
MTGTLATVTGATDVDVPNLTARVAGTEIGARTLNELRARLAEELYRTFHQGARPAAVHPRDLVDPALEAELKAAVPHPAVRVPTRLLSEDGEEATVVLAGLRVRVPRARVGTRDGTTVELPPYRPSLSPGFLSVVGSRLPRAQGGPVLRLYLHVPDAGAAPAVWGAVLRRLEGEGLPYRAKILSHPDRYPRRDAMVVYVTDEAERAVDTVAGTPLDLADPVSPFTRALAPGLSLAWDPAPRAGAARQPSFGQHRARACADGLVDHARYGIPVAEALARALRAAGADPALPHRNLDSPCPAL